MGKRESGDIGARVGDVVIRDSERALEETRRRSAQVKEPPGEYTRGLQRTGLVGAVVEQTVQRLQAAQYTSGAGGGKEWMRAVVRAVVVELYGAVVCVGSGARLRVAA